MNYAPRITNYRPDWSYLLEKLPPVKEYVPMTAREFKRLQSSLLLVMGGNTLDRKLAGSDPLPPFHPIAKRALPRLRSLEKR